MNISVLLGKTIESITGKEGSSELLFEMTNGEIYRFCHYQDCCEDVFLADVCGDLDDIIGSPLLLAEQVDSTDEELPDVSTREDDCNEWTFYKLVTEKGAVTLRWFGSSNGYYSVDVEFEEITGENNEEL